MELFETRDDVEEWLEPLTYEAFWREVAIHDLDLPAKEACDGDIASKVTDEATVLGYLKTLARYQLVARHELVPRDTMPWYTLQ